MATAGSEIVHNAMSNTVSPNDKPAYLETQQTQPSEQQPQLPSSPSRVYLPQELGSCKVEIGQIWALDNMHEPHDLYFIREVFQAYLDGRRTQYGHIFEQIDQETGNTIGLYVMSSSLRPYLVVDADSSGMSAIPIVTVETKHLNDKTYSFEALLSIHDYRNDAFQNDLVRPPVVISAAAEHAPIFGNRTFVRVNCPQSFQYLEHGVLLAYIDLESFNLVQDTRRALMDAKIAAIAALPEKTMEAVHRFDRERRARLTPFDPFAPALVQPDLDLPHLLRTYVEQRPVDRDLVARELARVEEDIARKELDRTSITTD